MTKEESLKKDIKNAIETLKMLSIFDIDKSELIAVKAWQEGYKSAMLHAINHLQFTLKIHELSKDFCNESN